MESFHKKIFIILFAAVFVLLPAATFIFMPRDPKPFSENENRFLSRFTQPDFTGFFKNFFNDKSNNIKDKRFMNSFDSWFADRFIFRENWIVLKNNTETVQGKTEINGVFNVQGRLIQVWRDYDENRLDSVLKAMDDFASRNPEASVSFLLVPTAQEIYIDTLPPNSEPGNQKALIKYCYDRLENITGIDALTPLSENRVQYIYFRTDHHWTSYGAYWGYHAACARLGLTPYEPGWFNIEYAASDFRGTLYSKTLNSKTEPDVIQFYIPAPNRVTPPNVKVTVNTGEEINEYDSLYFKEYLNTKDKYSVFLGTNSPLTEIVTDLENNDKSLLVFKDSYAHIMLPFLTNHYKKITVLDMRYIKTDIREYIDLEEYEQILFIYNAVTFSEESNLLTLNLVK
jgi:hypothetical protein